MLLMFPPPQLVSQCRPRTKLGCGPGLEPPTAAKQALLDCPLLIAGVRAFSGTQRRPRPRNTRGLRDQACLARKRLSAEPPRLPRMEPCVASAKSSPHPRPALRRNPPGPRPACRIPRAFLNFCIRHPSGLLVGCGSGKHRQLHSSLRVLA